MASLLWFQVNNMPIPDCLKESDRMVACAAAKEDCWVRALCWPRVREIPTLFALVPQIAKFACKHYLRLFCQDAFSDVRQIGQNCRVHYWRLHCSLCPKTLWCLVRIENTKGDNSDTITKSSNVGLVYVPLGKGKVHSHWTTLAILL